MMAVAVFMAVGMASAITDGQPDGNKHPNVGALVGIFDGQTYPYCSETLISPTVFLTAAHCSDGGSTVYVTFDSIYTSKSKLYTGTFHSNELYPGSQDDPYDIAVVVFDKPIRGITPTQLPTLGQLDSLSKDQQFTAIGYGGQEAVNGLGGPVIGTWTRASTRSRRSTRSARATCVSRRTRRQGTAAPATATRADPTSLALALPRLTSSRAPPLPATRCASPPTYDIQPQDNPLAPRISVRLRLGAA
jgi:hypothetical protein